MSSTTIINYAVLGDRLSTFARKAGRTTTRPMLLLYYVMKSKETPKTKCLSTYGAQEIFKYDFRVWY